MGVDSRLYKPIFILGAARSGTTMLAHILRTHPDVAFWDEPNHVWMYGHEMRRTDVLKRNDVKPNIERYIRSAFTNYTERMGKKRFLDKTPHNSLRLEFITTVFPDAKIIHMIRDGRDVAISAVRQWRVSEVEPSIVGRAMRITKRLRILASSKRPDSVADVPRLLAFYKTRLIRDIKRWLFPSRIEVWGPRFPGIEDVARTYSLLETCAIQWEWCVKAALGIGRRLPDDQYLEVKFEEFLNDPKMHIRRILQFAELPLCEEVIEVATTFTNPKNQGKWRELPIEQLDRIMRHIAPTLAFLEYL